MVTAAAATAAAVLAIDDNNDLFTADSFVDSFAADVDVNVYAYPLKTSLLEPSLDQSFLLPVLPELVGSEDMFINPSDNPSVGEELDLLDEGGGEGGGLGGDYSAWVDSNSSSSAPLDDCSISPTFRSRRQIRRNEPPLECKITGTEAGGGAEAGDGSEPYFQNFRELAGQSAQKLSNFDVRNCLGVLPYLVCSSNDPVYTVYWPGILSWVLYESSRGTYI